MKTSSRSKRIGLIALWLLLFLVGAPFWLAYRQMRREQLSYTLIAAIRREDTVTALSALEAGADPNARDSPPKQVSLWQRVQKLLASWRGQPPSPGPEGPSAVFLAAENEEVDVVHSLFVRGADKAGFVKAWRLSHEATMLGETPGHDPPRYIPSIARLAGARIGYSTIEDLERWWGPGAEFTGGHPRGGRAWRVRHRPWAIDADGFDYSSRGRVLDWFALSLETEPNGATPLTRSFRWSWGWMGTVYPGMTQMQVLRAVKGRLPKPLRQKNIWVWKARGFVRLNWNNNEADTKWTATLSFEKGRLADITVAAE